MSDNNDGTATDETVDGEGSAGTPNQKPSTDVDPLALARKRQAGAEAARQKAQEEAAELRKRLEVFEAANRTASEKDLADNAKLQERLAAAEARAAEAEAKAEARILDIQYPNARAKLPEITDEVRLAEFEALFAETVSEEKKPLPAPQNPNETNRSASGDATAKGKAEESSADIEARLRQMARPDWLGGTSN